MNPTDKKPRPPIPSGDELQKFVQDFVAGGKGKKQPYPSQQPIDPAVQDYHRNQDHIERKSHYNQQPKLPFTEDKVLARVKELWEQYKNSA